MHPSVKLVGCLLHLPDFLHFSKAEMSGTVPLMRSGVTVLLQVHRAVQNVFMSIIGPVFSVEEMIAMLNRDWRQLWAK
jgi:hypothetical protein